MDQRGGFETTRWTIVVRAAVEDPRGQRPALASLFECYQQPLYGFARARGMTHDDAVDALQDFFCDLLDGSTLAVADPHRGRFRAFLLTLWKRFLTDQYRRRSAQKRGGATAPLSIHVVADPHFDAMLLKGNSDPTDVFDRQWADTLLEAARRQLEEDYRQRGREKLVSQLFPYLTAPLNAEDTDQLSRTLELSPTAIKVALHRLRNRFGQVLRGLVAQTVDDPAEVDAEIDSLLATLG
jgi:RNA polymerase sigma-70 factor (ECF subfamily)